MWKNKQLEAERRAEDLLGGKNSPAVYACPVQKPRGLKRVSQLMQDIYALPQQIASTEYNISQRTYPQPNKPLFYLVFNAQKSIVTYHEKRTNTYDAAIC